MSNNKNSVSITQANTTTRNNSNSNSNSNKNNNNSNSNAVAASANDIIDFLQEKGVAIMVVQPLISGGVMIYGKEVENKEAKSLISQIKQNPNYFEKAIGISDEDEEEEEMDVYELPDGSLVEAVTPVEAKTAKVVKARKDGDGNLQKVI